ncbi:MULTISPECIES: hypothetical protein [Cyanophyceae]|uniref:hypothetical protein n=1 Tax=Cyanophyceae TaxID=3028117 RepID=UPI0016822BB0|nr:MULTISPECIES: hypothetical protein [Cyanophyceae]MBD1917707.1 hypothetical protein [Phormidium sp. FACHB-77]MBD2032805.1 hypothetical protein [Phormidium sp. FACHB-322]MBD2053134.1 hypothetical protein [Leptolyngbya sp. FACHB-60]
MAVDNTLVKVTLRFTDPSLGLDEQDLEVQKLLPQLAQLARSGDIEQSGRVLDPNPPEKSKGFGFLLGLLQAEVSAANFKGLSQFLGERLLGKTIEMEVEANGKKLKLKASSQAELSAALKVAQEFIAS